MFQIPKYRAGTTTIFYTRIAVYTWTLCGVFNVMVFLLHRCHCSKEFFSLYAISKKRAEGALGQYIEQIL